MVLHLTLVALFLLAPRHHHHHHHFQVSDVDSYDLLATANAMESEGMAAAVADNLQDAGFDDAAADPADTTTFNEEVGGGPARRLPSLPHLSLSPTSLPHLSLLHLSLSLTSLPHLSLSPTSLSPSPDPCVQVVDMPDDDVRSVDVLIAQVRRQPQPLPCVHALCSGLFGPGPHRAMQSSSPSPLSHVSAYPSCRVRSRWTA